MTASRHAPTASDRGMAWAHWVNGIDGVLLFIAPLVLGYSSNQTALWDNYVLGALIAIFSFVGLASGADKWTQWVVGILGILSFISPWVLGYSGVTAALWANIVLGAIAIVVAAVDLFVSPAQPAV